MEIRFSSQQEAALAQLAAAEGRSPDELVQEAVARFTLEKQAEQMSDEDHAAALADFCASLDEADASIDRGEGVLVASEADRAALVSDIMERARARLAAAKPSH